MPTLNTFTPKQKCYINAIRENIFYYTAKNGGKKPAVIFMSEPLYNLLCGGEGNKQKSKFDTIRVYVFYDESYSYWFANNEQKGSGP